MDNLTTPITISSDINISTLNIINRDSIEFTEVKLIDNRLDNLLFGYYGVNYNVNYGVSRELFIYLILCFNDIHDLTYFSSRNNIIKLPNIMQLFDNIKIVNNNKVNGVYDNLIDEIFNNDSDNNNNEILITNDVVNELRLKLSKVSYDKNTGKIKF